jgi:hypothetical protein
MIKYIAIDIKFSSTRNLTRPEHRYTAHNKFIMFQDKVPHSMDSLRDLPHQKDPQYHLVQYCSPDKIKNQHYLEEKE